MCKKISFSVQSFFWVISCKVKWLLSDIVIHRNSCSTWIDSPKISLTSSYLWDNTKLGWIGTLLLEIIGVYFMQNTMVVGFDGMVAGGKLKNLDEGGKIYKGEGK